MVQVDRRSGQIRDDAGVRAKYGVAPEHIPDWLALVGDAADGYPGIARFGKRTAARLIGVHGPIERFPAAVLDGENREHAMLFKDLATLRTNAELFDDVDELRWRGATNEFDAIAERMGMQRLYARVDGPKPVLHDARRHGPM